MHIQSKYPNHARMCTASSKVTRCNPVAVSDHYCLHLDVEDLENLKLRPQPNTQLRSIVVNRRYDRLLKECSYHAAAGISELLVQTLGRWRRTAYKTYIQSSPTSSLPLYYMIHLLPLFTSLIITWGNLGRTLTLHPLCCGTIDKTLCRTSLPSTATGQ